MKREKRLVYSYFCGLGFSFLLCSQTCVVIPEVKMTYTQLSTLYGFTMNKLLAVSKLDRLPS